MIDLMRGMFLFALFPILGCAPESSGQMGRIEDEGGDLRGLLVTQGYIEVPMTRLSTGHFSVTGTAATVSLDLIVDTGSSHTLVDTGRIERFGIEIGDEGSRATGLDYSNQAVKSGSLVDVAVGEVRMDSLRVTVVDLSQVNRVLDRMGEERIDGILGSDALVAREAVIDYGSRSLYLKE